MRTASELATPPPKQKPTAPTLPVDCGCALSQPAAATKSAIIFGAVDLAEHLAPFSSSPG